MSDTNISDESVTMMMFSWRIKLSVKNISGICLSIMLHAQKWPKVMMISDVDNFCC